MGLAQTALTHHLFPRNGSGLLNSPREQKPQFYFSFERMGLFLICTPLSK